jgi:hypothetical protein
MAPRIGKREMEGLGLPHPGTDPKRQRLTTATPGGNNAARTSASGQTGNSTPPGFPGLSARPAGRSSSNDSPAPRHTSPLPSSSNVAKGISNAAPPLASGSGVEPGTETAQPQTSSGVFADDIEQFVDRAMAEAEIPLSDRESLLDHLSAVHPRDRSDFLADVRAALESPMLQPEFHTEIIQILSKLPKEERAYLAQKTNDMWLWTAAKHAVLGALVREARENRSRLIACLESRLIDRSRVHGEYLNVIQLVGEIKLDRFERAIHLAERIPDLAGSKGVPAAIRALNAMNNHEARVFVDAVDLVVKDNAPLNGPLAVQLRAELHKLLAASSADSDMALEPLRRMSDCMGQLGYDETGETAHWVAGLSAKALDVLHRTLDLPTTPLTSKQDLHTALSHASLRWATSSTPEAAPAAEVANEKAWLRCFKEMLSHNAMLPPWDTMPMARLLPYRSEASYLLEQTHPGAAARKQFSRDDDSDRLVNYLQLLHQDHMATYLSTPEAVGFNYQKAMLVSTQARELYVAAAERLDDVEGEFQWYETKRFMKTIYEPLVNIAKEQNRPLILVPIPRSGLTPVTAMGLPKVRANGVRVIPVKQPSTGVPLTPGNPPLVRTPLLSELIQSMVAQPTPIVLAVDVTSGSAYPRSFRRLETLCEELNRHWFSSEGLNPSMHGELPFPTSISADEAVIGALIRRLASQVQAPKKRLQVHYVDLARDDVAVTGTSEIPSRFKLENVKGGDIVCCRIAMRHEDIELSGRGPDGDAEAARVVSLGQHKMDPFNDSKDALTPWIYLSRHGRLKVNPPVHRLARGKARGAKDA